MAYANVTALLSAMKSGDEKAFEKLYISTKKGVFAFIYTYLHNVHETEDAMHTVYLKIKENVHKFADCTNGRAWLLQICKNHALNVIKKNSKTVGLNYVFDMHTEEKAFSEGSVTYAMQKVLTEEEQQIITLHVLWGYKHKELAKMLEMPTGTVTSKYKRAIDKLKKELKEERA